MRVWMRPGVPLKFIYLAQETRQPWPLKRAIPMFWTWISLAYSPTQKILSDGFSLFPPFYGLFADLMSTSSIRSWLFSCHFSRAVLYPLYGPLQAAYSYFFMLLLGSCFWIPVAILYLSFLKMNWVCNAPSIEVRSATKNKQVMHDTDQARYQFYSPDFSSTIFSNIHRERNNRTKERLTSTFYSRPRFICCRPNVHGETRLTFPFLYGRILKKENLLHKNS